MADPLTILEILQAELGSRNVTKYYTGGSGPALLAEYVAEGIDLLAAAKPFKVTGQIEATGQKELPLPDGMSFPIEIWWTDHKLNKARNYEVYAGDSLVNRMYDRLQPFEIDSFYPDQFEHQLFGDWLGDMTREVVVFAAGMNGTVKFYGHGVPAETVLAPRDRREVANYALGRALMGITASLMAKMDINMEGMVVKQKTAEYSEEGRRLVREFEARNEKYPYMSAGR